MTATVTPVRSSYIERRSGLSSVTFKGKCVFDSKERELELILAQSAPDEDADPFENLVLPLKVLLVESYNKDKDPSEKRGHEDMYMFTHEGDFMGHLYRSFTRNSGARNYDQTNFTQDRDLSKLFRYGEFIRDMMKGVKLGYPLDVNPTILKLRAGTVWQD